MAKAYSTWTVHRHGPLEKLTENIWRVVGSVPGPPIPRTMVLVRLRDGSLVVHSAVALDEATMKEVEALGPLAFLLVPGIGHRLDAPAFKARYPSMTVMCPAGARKNVEEVLPVDRTDIAFDDPDVTWRPIDGTAGREGALSVRSAQGTSLVLNDTMMNMPHIGGFGGLIGRVIGFTGPIKLPPITRFLLVKDRAALRADFERLAAETPDLRRIIPSHGDVVTEDPQGALRRVAGSL
jgi:hypothetical protein